MALGTIAAIAGSAPDAADEFEVEPAELDELELDEPQPASANTRIRRSAGTVRPR
ncbi:MAG TPA: hypothetical protein VFW18_03320 [Gaiellales bacterium]|nr:hypothetical protein [Gaiellales bacterium]